MLFVVVTGGRHYPHIFLVERALECLKPDIVIHGNNGNVDLTAHRWATVHAIPHPYPAEFTKHGKPAGPMRNHTMASVAATLRECPGAKVIPIAFPGNKGTKDCCRELVARGFQVLDGEVLGKRNRRKLFEVQP